jgi:Transcriptional regulator, AbiEi antitoxin
VPIDIPDGCCGLIAMQRGVIGRRQALASGLAADTIETLLRTGRWRRIHRGVYAAFTGEPAREALLWAAVVHAGPDAMLSHQTAAELYGFADDLDGPIHVTGPRDGAHPGRIAGAVVHRVGRAREARHPYFLPPRTGIEATVLDLAGSALTLDEAFGWLCRATGKWLTTADRLRPGMLQRPAMRWRAELLGSLDMVDDGVRSNLEHRYVRDVERPHGLPRAVRQARVVRYGKPCYLDNLYEECLVCVELDGLAAHPPGERWRDFRRDNAGAVDGIITLRYGWPDVTGSPCEVAAQVAAVLRQRGWTGVPRCCGRACRMRAE